MNDTLRTFTEIVLTLLREEQDHPVTQHIPADELMQRVDLSLPEDPVDDETFTNAVRELVLKTPRTATRRFFNQLFGGRNEKAVLGDLLSVILNNSMYTYKVAGPQVGVERTILKKVCEMIGWDEDSGGTFASGGSMTNFMALLMARDRTEKSIRSQGFGDKKLTAYTSSDSHYSISKNAAFAGMGRNQVRMIPTNETGEMIPSQLLKAIQRDKEAGYVPTFVNLTAGTTVLGSFDPIPEVAEICKEHDIWLHVDGAYCGSVLFSNKYKYLINGIEEVDSFSFNAHKMLATPLTCSLLLVKDKKYLYDSFSNDADYLYQTDHDEFNLGKTSLQCGRRNDALKFWTLWKSVGTKGLEAIVDQQFYLADVAREYVRSNSDYTLYSFDESVSVCFNYKDVPARTLCTLLFEESELQVGYGSFRGEEFVRLVTVNSGNSKEEIITFFKVIEEFVAKNQELLAAQTRA